MLKSRRVFLCTDVENVQISWRPKYHWGVCHGFPLGSFQHFPSRGHCRRVKRMPIITMIGNHKTWVLVRYNAASLYLTFRLSIAVIKGLKEVQIFVHGAFVSSRNSILSALVSFYGISRESGINNCNTNSTQLNFTL